MPYIDPKRREELDTFESDGKPAQCAGELNYIITKLILDYQDRLNHHGYQTINDIIGALDGAKLEYYLKHAVGYEALKERTNGDVYKTNASSTNIAWAGGFFEGEGCFYAHYYRPRLDGTKVYRTAASLVQKHEGLLLQFKNVVKCGVVYPDGEDGMFVWKTTKVGEAKKIFELLRPYLGERRQTTFMALDAEEHNQIFRPPRPPRTQCSRGHDLNEVGTRKDGACAECSREYQRKWYHENK